MKELVKTGFMCQREKEMKRLMMCILAGVFLHSIAGPVLASGMLIPGDSSVPPLAIKHQRVNISIKDGTATVALEQVFQNSVNRDLEATYIFPLPENASIADFAMYIGGKRMSGELVEKDKARQIYEDIVRRMKDPGLLEHMGGNLFKIRVFPVPRNGEQKIELSYSQTLEFENGLYKFVYPLKTDGQASRTLEDFTIKAGISSVIPVKNIYSPSHKIGISRKDDHTAIIGFEENKSLLDRDFALYYGISKKDFGVNLLTHARKGEDGFFMLMLSPTIAPDAGRVVRRDVTFVFDTSGSMLGEKLQQTREAMKYCVRKLNKEDRFNIIRFSTEAETLAEGMLPADDDSINRAIEFIDRAEARGGTAIDDALAKAMAMGSKGDRPHVVVFLTDGKPTIGETDVNGILDNVGKKAGDNTRIFVFGVGEDLNAILLDRLSADHGGVSKYVKPGEDIEVHVSGFADTITLPVLAKTQIGMDKLETRMIHPGKLPDLFAGGQITIFGRYSGHGDHAIRLSGEINGKNEEYVFEGTFPKENIDNDFIPRLWATRRVGYLLDQIRLHGENQELKDETVRLGKEYGIMTPYTSYLVLEDDQAYATHGINRAPATTEPAVDRSRRSDEFIQGGSRAFAPTRVAAKSAAAAPMSSADYGLLPSAGAGFSIQKANSVDVAPAEVLRKEEGRDAISVSEAISEYKKADTSDDRIAPTVRQVGGKLFHLIDGIWTDRDYKKDMKAIKVKYASDEYFKLLADKPDLKKYFALGEKVIVCTGDNTAIIVE